MPAQNPSLSQTPASSAARPPVWARMRTGGRGPQPSLSVDAIVSAAVALADAEGVEAVSMRRIATELGVGTMSLYRYVETKDDLLDLMTDQAMGGGGPDADPTGDWRADLRAIAVGYRELMLRHPWMLPISASRPSLGPQMLGRTERLLGVLDGRGLTVDAMSRLTGTVVAWVRGVVLTEIAEAEVARRTGQSEDDYRRTVHPYLAEVLAEGRHPLLARFVEEADDHPDPERNFAWGLELVLDGIEAAVTRLSGD